MFLWVGEHVDQEMVGGGDSECSGGTSQTSKDEETIFARGDEGDGKREDTEGGESDFEDDRGGEQVTESAGEEELLEVA